MVRRSRDKSENNLDPSNVSDYDETRSIKSQQSRGSRSKQARRGSIDSRFNEENLGDDFEDTPWLPPSMAKAQIYKESAIIRQGDAPLRTVQVCKAADLGQGVSLYFQFVKSMCICMFVGGVLAIPSLIFCYEGSRIPTQDRDAIGFYKFMLGNIGYSITSPTYFQDSACTHERNINATSSCIHLFNDKYEMTLTEVGSVLTLTEVIFYFVFMSATLFLFLRMKSLSKLMDNENHSICDYSIMVKNLPQDCSFQQILSHFSKLYGLDKPDWKKRLQVEGAHPVYNVERHNRKSHLNTWVSELTVFKKIGKYISAFKAQEDLTTKLFRCRAKMKMYAEDTPFAKGPNKNKHKKAFNELLRTQLKIDKVAQTVIQQRDLAFKVDHSQFGKGIEEVDLDYKDYNTQIDAPIVAAFVTFEYAESMARCVEDYTTFQTFPRNFFFPQELKFRGSRIDVSQAPEPDDIAWENLEVSTTTKMIKRLITTVVMIGALLCSFLVILSMSTFKKAFTTDIPDLNLCPIVLPSQYQYGGYSKYKNMDTTNFIQTRPPLEKRQALDNQCSQIQTKTFYSTYTYLGNISAPIASYNFDACTNSLISFCPNAAFSQFCPCTSSDSTQKCSTYECTTEGSTSAECKTFTANLGGACFCFSQIQELLKSGEGLNLQKSLDLLNSNEQCKPFYYAYMSQYALTYVATFLVVIINKIMEYFLWYLNKNERHSSLSNEGGSYMLKIFISQYINMAVVVLFAFGKVTKIPSILAKIGFFQGTFEDFTTGWYGAVGNYLMLTFIIQVISVPIYPMTLYYIVYPFYRWRDYPSVRIAANPRIVMQEDLNNYEVGPVFETSYSTANVLALVFFAMTFAAGLPLLIPMLFASLAFIFNFDKLLICRFYHRPARISEGIIHTVIYFLPYAEILRLAFGIWMYGDNTLLSQNVIDTTVSLGAVSVKTSSYEGWLSATWVLGEEYAWIERRSLRPNTFPLLLLLLFTVAVLLLNFIRQYLIPFDIIFKELYKSLVRCLFNHQEIKIHPEASPPSAPNNLSQKPLWGIFKSKKGGLDMSMNNDDFLGDTATTQNGDENVMKLNANISPIHNKYNTEDDENAPPAVPDMLHGYELLQLDDPLRQEVAPFSEQYFTYVLDKDEIPSSCNKIMCKQDRLYLTEQDIIDGWVHVDHEKYVLKCKIWTDKSSSDPEILKEMEDAGRHVGDFKRTYEVIADAGCASYNLENVPAYRKAIIAIEQGAQNMEEDQIMNDEELGYVAKGERRFSANSHKTSKNAGSKKSNKSRRNLKKGGSSEYSLDNSTNLDDETKDDSNKPGAVTTTATLASQNNMTEEQWEALSPEEKAKFKNQLEVRRLRDSIMKKNKVKSNQRLLKDKSMNSDPTDGSGDDSSDDEDESSEDESSDDESESSEEESDDDDDDEPARKIKPKPGHK